MRFDVGIGVVEKHYDFFDMSYLKVCSYEPEAISINYDSKLEIAGNSVLALGWGAANARKVRIFSYLLFAVFWPTIYTVVNGWHSCT